MTILVTGGCGYIGTHTIVELLTHGYRVVVVDNLSNSNAEALKRVERITGKTIPLYIGDCTDKTVLEPIFASHTIDAVMHFASLKSVDESVKQPLRYYHNNINSALSVCDLMQQHGVHKFIFSSSATVYGTPEQLPLTEVCPTGNSLASPYAQTKYMIEQILCDITIANSSWQVTVLRYFNPVGAHESGLIGEDPNGPPNNLTPYIAQVAVGRREFVRVFGNDYDTPDGTGVRDYIHVVDLARGHVAALEHLHNGFDVYNLGTGHGTSVMEAIHGFEVATGKPIPYEIVVRRPGDIASYYADPTKANNELGWHTERSFQDACNDTWRWQSTNPKGFTSD